MPKFENNILGFIPREEWIDVGFNVTRQNDPIDGLFGDEKTDNITARWESIAYEYQIPMMAQFHGFDTEAQTTFRIPVDNHNIEKGLIKVKINQSERMKALLRSGVQNDEMYDYVLDDGIRLADEVFTRTKVAKNELMATGQVTIKENNLDLTVDYGVPSAQKSLTIDFSGDVFGQIDTIVTNARDRGINISGMYTSSSVISKMKSNSSIQTAINGSNAVGATIRRSALTDYLADEFGITQIVTNDYTYGASHTIDTSTGRPSIVTKRYFPKDKITFFASNPGGRLGTGLWGDPPEVDLGQFYNVEGSSVSPYVFVTQKMEWDPAVLWTKASGLFIPVLYNPESLFIASVTNTGA